MDVRTYKNIDPNYPAIETWSFEPKGSKIQNFDVWNSSLPKKLD